jgi:hypothetical protein
VGLAFCAGAIIQVAHPIALEAVLGLLVLGWALAVVLILGAFRVNRARECWYCGTEAPAGQETCFHCGWWLT